MLANHNAIESALEGYVIDRSLRFSSASSQYLTRTATTPTSGTTWSWSGWVKRGALTSAVYSIFGGGTNGTTTYDALYYSSSTNTLQFFTAAGASLYLETSQVFRDPSAHYHILAVYDSTQATASNRAKLYINGVQVTSFSTANYPAQNTTSLGVNANSVIQTLGAVRTNAIALPFDGYMSEVHFIDGQALTPASFGEINSATGQWVAKKYTGTHGTNGVYLDFKDGTSTTTLGQDKSGNGNNWTLTNFTRSAGVNDCWMLDVPAGNGSASAVQPSGNYAVLNPLKRYSANLNFSKGNLTVSDNSASISTAISSFFLPTTGKYYFEVTTTIISGANGFIGVATETTANGNTAFQSEGRYRSNGDITNLAGTLQTGGTSYTSGDVIGVAVDVDNGTVQFYKNNVAQGATPSFTFTAGTKLVPYIATDNNAAVKTFEANFGQRSFAYTPPAGFKALCTANLPTPSIKKPSDHFNVQLSTGANIKTDSEALFINELEWIKDRANANNHQLIDSVRGSTAVLQSNTNAVETTYSAPSGSSVGWVWRASDSASVTNNNGSISSQVSANTTAGFSVVTYTGTGSNATVGHGLGVSPNVIITMRRNLSADWQMYNSNLGVDKTLQLNQTAAVSTITNYWAGGVNSTTFGVNGSWPAINASGGTYVAYCFAEIAGYSKFGSYTGNGSADGPFVYTGFRPRFVMIKRTDTTSNWTMFDNQRDGYNVDNDQLYANTTGAEVTTDLLDITSNSFKARSTDASINANGGTYIYMTFAETPFNYANAR